MDEPGGFRYRKLIDVTTGRPPVVDEEELARDFAGPDAQEGEYVYDPEILLALNVALAAGRPLLVRGEPGTGKSLARHVAEHVLRWRYRSFTMSSRTQARDLMWTFDAVARLSDAQATEGELSPRDAYVSPGVLWWAFDSASAERQQRRQRVAGRSKPVPQEVADGAARTVLLIDEIDKAEPDVPNDLLEPLSRYQFTVEEMGLEVKAARLPLIVITTNEERELPRAFVRRCAELRLKFPGPERLLEIARAHFPGEDSGLHLRIATEFLRIRDEAKKSHEPAPGTAEYLDTVRACMVLGSSDDGEMKELIDRLRSITLKRPLS
jgi:MoxR-like ATPase